ncbi:MAG TPA: MFS transporter [Polyangiaceae bacterium]|jgi:ACS family hexuronate transporter-like MFS transporter
MNTSATTAGERPATPRFYVKGLRWWIAVLLTGVTVVNYLDRTCLSITAPVFKTQLHINEVEYSRIVVAFQIAYMLMQPVSGRFIDWINLRKGVAISIFWWSMAQMLTAFAGTPLGFASFRALLGIGEAGNFPAGAKTVSEWFRPHERTIATGIFNMGSGFGGMIAPFLVTSLLMTYGWQAAFVVTGVIGVVWVGLWLLVYRSPAEHPWLSPKERAYIEEEKGEIVVQDTPSGTGVWKVVLLQKNFWALAIARFLSEPAWQFFTYWIPLYLATERHMSIKSIQWFAWAPFLAGDFGSLFGGVLSPIFIKLRCSVLTARKLSTTVCALLMMFAIFIGSAPTAVWAIVFFCIAAFAHQAMSATLLTLPADLFPKRTVATANGLSGSFGQFGGMLFTLVVGYVALNVGYAPLFVAIAFFDFIGSMVLWALLREGPRQTATNAA